jgi:hypothetical protein
MAAKDFTTRITTFFRAQIGEIKGKQMHRNYNIALINPGITLW